MDTAEHAKTGEPPKSVQCTDIKKRVALVMITDDQLKGEISPFKYEFSSDKGWFPSSFILCKW